MGGWVGDIPSLGKNANRGVWDLLTQRVKSRIRALYAIDVSPLNVYS